MLPGFYTFVLHPYIRHARPILGWCGNRKLNLVRSFSVIDPSRCCLGFSRSAPGSPPSAEHTFRRAVAVRFDRSLTCVSRRSSPNPSVRTIDKTMSDGQGLSPSTRQTHGYHTQKIGYHTQGTTTRRKPASLRRPPGLSVCAHVRKSARTHARTHAPTRCYWRFLRLLPAAHPGAL